MTRIVFTIAGQPCSKANSRQIVTIGDRPKPIKSKVALAYERDSLPQIPVAARQRLEGPVKVTATLYYANELSDLDESIVLDVLQDRWQKRDAAKPGEKRPPRVLLQPGVYRNDRQVRWKDIRHGIDRYHPRAEIIVEAMAVGCRVLRMHALTLPIAPPAASTCPTCIETAARKGMGVVYVDGCDSCSSRGIARSSAAFHAKNEPDALADVACAAWRRAQREARARARAAAAACVASSRRRRQRKRWDGFAIGGGSITRGRRELPRSLVRRGRVGDRRNSCCERGRGLLHPLAPHVSTALSTLEQEMSCGDWEFIIDKRVRDMRRLKPFARLRTRAAERLRDRRNARKRRQ